MVVDGFCRHVIGRGDGCMTSEIVRRGLEGRSNIPEVSGDRCRSVGRARRGSTESEAALLGRALHAGCNY